MWWCWCGEVSVAMWCGGVGIVDGSGVVVVLLKPTRVIKI